MASLDDLIRTKRTIVCVGPGGVGKTTTSAAIALRAALSGRKTLVLTVDPAHRLANSLGLKRFEAHEQEIDLKPFVEAGQPAPAPLYAMMLDTKRTFDSIVARYAPNEETRRRILESPFYEQASTRLAGSQEYMAMEKLYELDQERRFDLIVLDTPPTVHALDFLDAPSRLEDFMSQNTEGLRSKGTRALSRIGLGFLKANSMILRGISKFLGADVFVDILDFLSDFSSMYTGFKSRARAVKELMRSPAVTFLVLTSPESASVDEGLYFHQRLHQDQMPFGAFVVNRARRPFTEDGEALAADFRHALLNLRVLHDVPKADLQLLATRLIDNHHRYHLLATRDARDIERAREQLQGATLHVVPDFEEDIHSLEGLHRYGQHLAAPPGGPLPGSH